MATRHDSEPALGDTEEIGADEVRPQAIGPADEDSQAGVAWPVAREYRVDGDGNGGIPAPAPAPETETQTETETDAEAGEMVVTAPPRSRRLPVLIGTGLLGALLAILLLLGAAWVLSGGEENGPDRQPAPARSQAATKPKASPSSVAVPDVAGLELSRARSVLEDAGFRVESRSTASDSGATPGEVLRQTPAAGTDVESGSLVVLTVSGAQSRTQVPTVLGLMASDATQALQEAGLRGEIRLVRSEKPPGTVLDQSPSPGASIAADGVVRLEVAKASAPATIAVPRVVGSSAAEAKSRLRDLGLRWTTSGVESERPEGTVVRQSPGAGARLRKGQPVALEVSTGPARATIPDVTGLDEQSARSQLEAAGFTVQVTDEPAADSSQDGLVTGQSPRGGSKGEKAGVVTLTVARFTETQAETVP